MRINISTLTLLFASVFIICPHPVSYAQSPGALDPTFGSGGIVSTAVGSGNDIAQAVAVQADGRIVVAGYAFNGLNNDFALIRYSPDGMLDETFDGAFNGNGIVTTAVGAFNDEAFGISIQPDGKIVVCGQSSNGTNRDIAVVRYNIDGTLDNTFDGDGRAIIPVGPGEDFARSVAIAADGTIVVAGNASNGTNFDFAVVRLLPNGSLDSSFAGNSGTGNGIVTTPVGTGDEIGYAVAIQTDDRIVVAGYYAGPFSTDTVVLRYLADGRLDPTFDGDGISARAFSPETDEALALTLQSDGKIVIAGCIRNGAPNDFLLARFQPDGSVDTSFGTGGSSIIPFSGLADIALGVAVQTDGKIVAVGFGSNGSNNDFAVLRVNENGSPDTTFGDNGKLRTMIGTSTDSANAVAIQADGKIVVAGRAVINATSDFGVVRFIGSSSGAVISGRVLTPGGLGLRNARVSMIDSAGAVRHATASTFGFYNFENVQTGGSYTIRVSSKRYRFASRTVQLDSNLGDFNFVGLE